MCVWAIYIIPGSVHIFSCSRIDRSTVGISLTDTWMWKLGPRPHNSFSGNICFEFSVLCFCSARTGLPKSSKDGWNGREAQHTVWSICLPFWGWVVYVKTVALILILPHTQHPLTPFNSYQLLHKHGHTSNFMNFLGRIAVKLASYFFYGKQVLFSIFVQFPLVIFYFSMNSFAFLTLPILYLFVYVNSKKYTIQHLPSRPPVFQ
jgi:hypothetical protein